jgi:hypothetical protein
MRASRTHLSPEPARSGQNGKQLVQRFDHRKSRSGEEIHLTWYEATRHTFASHYSHYMMAGGNIAKLQAELEVLH